MISATKRFFSSKCVTSLLAAKLRPNSLTEITQRLRPLCLIKGEERQGVREGERKKGQGMGEGKGRERRTKGFCL